MFPSNIRVFAGGAVAACLAVVVLHSAISMAATVNINTADAATIAQELKGIGLKRAQAIVDFRGKNGPFKSADELALVKGIGSKVIQKNRADIRTDGARPGAAAVVRAPVKPSPPAPVRRQ